MLLTLVSLKGIWDRVYLLYEELQESVLISGCLLQGGRNTFLVLEVQGIIIDNVKKKTNKICLFSSCLIRDKSSLQSWVHLRDMQGPLHCIPLYYSGLSFLSSYRNWFYTMLRNKWFILGLLFCLVWLNLVSQDSLGSTNDSKPKKDVILQPLLPEFVMRI